MTYLTRILIAFALVGGMFLFNSGGGLGSSEAWAQTATKLNCKKCVGSKQIKKGAIKKNRLKEGAVTLGKLGSRLGERANSSQPYYITMDANNEQQTIISHGPLTLFARCFLNESDGAGGFQDAIRIFATSSVDGWFTNDDDGILATSGPFSAGDEIELNEDTTPIGTVDTSDLDDGNGALAPGGYVVGYSHSALVIGLNVLGHRCTLAGMINVLKGSP